MPCFVMSNRRLFTACSNAFSDTILGDDLGWNTAYGQSRLLERFCNHGILANRTIIPDPYRAVQFGTWTDINVVPDMWDISVCDLARYELRRTSNMDAHMNATIAADPGVRVNNQ